MSGPETPAPRPAAAIHDLGYKRYVGTRRPQSTRWRVIVKNLVSTSWRGWWRMKMWIIGAAMTTVGLGVPMFIWIYVSESMTNDLKRDGMAMNWADAFLPMSFSFYSWWGFLLGCTVAAGAVARDLRAGAFEFYFSRPVRPLDYLAGKVVGTLIIMGLGMAAGPLLLAIFRVGLAQSLDDVLPLLTVVPRAALVGLVSALAYAVVPLAISTLSPRPRITISIWVVFYFVFGLIVEGVSIGLQMPDLNALSISDAVGGLALGVFDVTMPMQQQQPPSAAASLGALVGYSVLGLAILHLRLKRAEQSGMGGG